MEYAVNKESKNYPPFRHVFHMQTSDLNVNNTESDHATAIFRQFQDAIFSREHTSVKTSTKILQKRAFFEPVNKLVKRL